MKRLGLVLFIVLIFSVFCLSAYAQDTSRISGKDFFTVNPSLRADVLAEEVMAKEDDLRQWLDATETLSPDNSTERVLPDADRWNKFTISGVTMSMSRFSDETNQGRKISVMGDEEEIFHDFWSQLLRGSIRGEDWENLGGVIQPELKLGIEF